MLLIDSGVWACCYVVSVLDEIDRPSRSCAGTAAAEKRTTCRLGLAVKKIIRCFLDTCIQIFIYTIPNSAQNRRKRLIQGNANDINGH